MSHLSAAQWQRRVRHYWIEDGLAETVLGLGFLGLTLLLGWNSRPHGASTPLRGLIQTAFILALGLGTRWVVQRLKWRITYPRTGYLAYPRQPWRRRLLRILVAAGALAGSAFLALSLWVDQTHAYLTVMTLSMAGLYLGAAWSQAWPRGAGYALVALLSGWAAGVWWAHPTWGALIRQGGLHFAALGVAQTLGGLWALRRYLRRHPHPIEEVTP